MDLTKFFNTENEKTEKVFKEKRYVAEPDDKMLTPAQKLEYDKILAFLKRMGGGFFLFMGYAGTGKTFVLTKVIEKMLATSKSKVILMTAPTNKAVRVMYDAADYFHSNLSYSTVHSGLGLKESIDKDGKQIFVKEWGREVSFDFTDIATVDEVSMLTDELS